jgi:hypothetical protein
MMAAVLRTRTCVFAMVLFLTTTSVACAADQTIRLPVPTSLLQLARGQQRERGLSVAPALLTLSEGANTVATDYEDELNGVGSEECDADST